MGQKGVLSPGRRTIAADALRHTWPLSHLSARTRENCSGAKRRAWWRYSRSPEARRTWTNSSEGGGSSYAVETHSAVCSFYLLTGRTKDGGRVWGRGGGHRRREQVKTQNYRLSEIGGAGQLSVRPGVRRRSPGRRRPCRGSRRCPARARTPPRSRPTPRPCCGR